MNMISTGAFPTEMDATRKLVRAWESKNARNAAKAGGVSMMALSLAACGSSSTTETTPVVETPVVETPVVETPVVDTTVGLTAALTSVNGETVTGSAKNDTFTGAISEVAGVTTLHTLDTLVDPSNTDADVMNIVTDQDIAITPTVKGVETINITVNALSAGADVTDFDLALTNFSKGATINVDSVKAGSIISSLTITGDAGHTINTTAAISTVTSALAADGDGVYDIDAVGNAVAPAALVVTGAADTVTADAAGYVTVTAAAVTDLVKVTSVNDTTVSATASAGVFITAGGKVTLTDVDSATIVNVTAGGNVSAATTKLTAAIAPVIDAGGTVSVFTDDATSITVGGKKTITVAEDNGTTLVLANVTVKGEATTIDLDSATGVVTATVAGDQDYILQMDAAGIDAGTDTITLTDTTTAGTSTLKLVANAGNVDASLNTIDTIDLAVNNAAKTLTVASGQSVNISIDQAAVTTIAGLAATASSNTVSVTFDDGTNSATTTAVDITGDLDFTNFGTVNLDMSGDSLSNLAAETHIIDDMDSSGNVNMTMGANKLSITGDLALGATNTLTITGTGTITGDGSESITVKAIDASGVTGVVTLTKIESEETGSVTTGSGKDVLTVTASGTEADLVLSSGGGDDTITLAGGIGTTRSVSIDGGAGTADTLVLSASAVHGATGANETFTISNVEFLSYSDDTTIASEAISGSTMSLIAATTSADTLTVSTRATDTTIDLSGLQVSLAQATGVSNDTFVVDGSALTAVTSISGTDVAKNTLTAGGTVGATVTGGALADALTGGAKVDTIVGGAGNDVIETGAGADSATGGTGNDEFNYAVADTGVTVATADIVLDFETGKDTLDLATFQNGTSTETLADASAAADFAALVTLASAAMDGTNEDLYVAYDAYGTGDTYVFVDADTSGAFAAGDILVILKGIDAASEIALADVI